MTASAKYPAKAHATKTASYFPSQDLADSLIILSAPSLELYPHCDQTQPFRQDRYFNYFTGAHDLPSAIVTYDPKQDRLNLYLPPIDEDDVMWSGLPISPEQALEKYDVDNVNYFETLVSFLKEENKKPVITIDERNKSVIEGLVLSSSTNTVEGKSNITVTVSQDLKEALDEARLRKDEYEISLMKKAAAISDVSHRAVMSALPIETNEGHIHAEFVYHSMRQGSKFQSYDPICCSGTDCGTLHYVRNDQEMGPDKQLVLIDAGAEWQCYASDVTRVFPISGEWSPEARKIYDAVLDMQTQCTEGVKPGVKWEDLHLLAHKLLIDHFVELGIFHTKHFTKEEILKARTSVAFLPHGLGHVLGMDTHDVGGKPNYEDPDPMYRYLRLRRTLEPGFVVTVEPGIYFNKFLLKDYLADKETHLKIIDLDVLEKYMPVGGVRLEDDVLVTETGYENFTKMTTDPEEVSKIVKEGIAKGRQHFHNLA